MSELLEKSETATSGISRRRTARSGWGLALGILSLIACMLPDLGLVLAIMGIVLSAGALRRRQYAGLATVAAVICSLAIALNSVIFIQRLLISNQLSQLKSEAGQGILSTPNNTPFGLQKSELPLSAVTVYGGWTEADALFDDESHWFGSAGAYSEKNGKHYFFTNAHVLGLEELFSADGDGRPEIKDYMLTIQFPSGITLPVLEFGIQKDGIDIAFLVVDATKVKRGKDYVFLPFDDKQAIEQGDEVVAVGSPQDLSGTQTFGRISAFRAEQVEGGSYRYIQTDAAINHGNSGGPLLLRRNDRYICIGINTGGIDGADNLGFAIEAAGVLKSDRFYWSDATVDALRKWIERL